MKPIDPEVVQQMIDRFREQEVFVHLEMTLGAYASHFDQSRHPASTFIKNARIRYTRGAIAGSGPYRVGLKTELGWIYSEGLTHYDETASDKLILAGHDRQGKLIVSLLIGREAFPS